MKSLAELQAIREKARAQISVREGQEDGIRILVGMATCGIAAGARPVLTAFIDELEKRGITNVQVLSLIHILNLKFQICHISFYEFCWYNIIV